MCFSHATLTIHSEEGEGEGEGEEEGKDLLSKQPCICGVGF